MRTPDKAALTNPQVPIQTKLAAAWTSFMFLYIYVDYLHLYAPGVLGDITNGVVWQFDISQTFVVSALASVAMPALMILLSATLPARVCRPLNLVAAALYIPYSAFNLIGASWVYYYGLGFALELIILVFVLRAAWTWPRTPAALTPAAPHRSQIRMGQ